MLRYSEVTNGRIVKAAHRTAQFCSLLIAKETGEIFTVVAYNRVLALVFLWMYLGMKIKTKLGLEGVWDGNI